MFHHTGGMGHQVPNRTDHLLKDPHLGISLEDIIILLLTEDLVPHLIHLVLALKVHRATNLNLLKLIITILL